MNGEHFDRWEIRCHWQNPNCTTLTTGKYLPFELCKEHDDVINWKYFPRYWPFVRRIHRSPMNSPHKGQWRGALMFSLICVCINGWVNNCQAGDLRRYRAHYDVTVMRLWKSGSGDLTHRDLNKKSRHFTDMFMCICMRQNLCILILISLYIFLTIQVR